MDSMFTCPCCGYEVFPDHPGSYDICPICFWEDDLFQLYYPHLADGSNPSSLIEAQVNFVQFGACDREMAKNARAPGLDDARDNHWFPLWERRVDIPDAESDKTHPQHMTSKHDLYYWLRP
ncbi:CPCC family cysteine-rich protein [Massilia sp. BJB1822]|uniref:CPCC family cysteine-rich protein n=1 Tax=Massilia sp. BJB1822 TaxID=2744470 RepID=UPI001C3C26FF|nr:CPCC family cysteine-rich protein [Massilia sp. BJB1822]